MKTKAKKKPRRPAAKPEKPILAWHFLADTGLLRNGKKPPADGKWLRHRGKIDICHTGLHASVKALDCLEFAPGAVVCRVECRGVAATEKDKLVCRERKILWRYDATKVLREFARKQALSVAHLWDMPKVVRDYLETGDEKLRAAARDAARDAARAAAWVAAWDAARAATLAAARAAAWDAARDAANEMLETMLTEGRP